MSSRFRAQREVPQIPEAEAADVTRLEKGKEWPVILSDAAASSASSKSEEDAKPSVVCNVEAMLFTATNFGMRHDNEDRPIIGKDTHPCGLDYHMIGVLDGHDTADASDLVSKSLPGILSKKYKAGHPVEEACVLAMADCEELLKRSPTGNAGTCCLCCTVAGRFVWCSNLGDCRAAMISLQPPVGKPGAGPQATRLTWLSRDHKASMPYEQERIRKAGGMVMDGRVEGLEPSRTLGDFDVKGMVKKGVISIVPEVRRHEICNGSEPGQALLVCATDGVWDVLHGKDVCNLINSRKDLVQLQASALAQVCGDGASNATDKASAGRGGGSSKEVLKDLAEDLVQFSIAKGSRDDCTAVVALITVAPKC